MYEANVAIATAAMSRIRVTRWPAADFISRSLEVRPSRPDKGRIGRTNSNTFMRPLGPEVQATTSGAEAHLYANPNVRAKARTSPLRNSMRRWTYRSFDRPQISRALRFLHHGWLLRIVRALLRPLPQERDGERFARILEFEFVNLAGRVHLHQLAGHW